MVRAALVQYGDRDIHIVRCKNVRTEEQIDSLMGDGQKKKGIVVYTMVSPQMRKKVFECAAEKAIPHVDLMGPLLNAFDSYLGENPGAHPAGLLRAVDDTYFKRIEAIE